VSEACGAKLSGRDFTLAESNHYESDIFTVMNNDAKILLSALAADVIPRSSAASVISMLKVDSTQSVDLQGLARAFYKPQLLRQIRTTNRPTPITSPSIEINGAVVSFNSDQIGRT